MSLPQNLRFIQQAQKHTCQARLTTSIVLYSARTQNVHVKKGRLQVLYSVRNAQIRTFPLRLTTTLVLSTVRRELHMSSKIECISHSLRHAQKWLCQALLPQVSPTILRRSWRILRSCETHLVILYYNYILNGN